MAEQTDNTPANGNKIEPQRMVFGKHLPFLLKEHTLLYAEPAWDENINRILAKNIDKVTGRYKKGQFLYLPHIQQQLPEILQYNRPDTDGNVLCDRDVRPQEFYDMLFAHRIDEMCWRPDTPVLMRFERIDSEGMVFIVFPIQFRDINDFARQLAQVFDYTEPLKLMPSKIADNNVRSSGIREGRGRTDEDSSIIRYSTIVEGVWDPRDNADNSSINTLAEEIRERIGKLQMMGLPNYLIHQMIALPEPQLSPLRITANYRLILPAYNNMVITMPTLSKVVYLFYLCHPEGVRFKELSDHRNELMEIYMRLSKRGNLDKMEQSIDQITDSTSNSINEKVSRIRAAFVSRFSDDLAKNYYIIGESGNPKFIPLNRNMIIDETKTLKLSK